MFLTQSMLAEAAAPSFERPIDLVHLARQTLGDRALEREVLELFVVQTRSVLARLDAIRDEKSRRELAHTIKGSARSVGAWRVASAAETCELAIDGTEAAWADSFAALAASVREACMAIAEIYPAA